MQPKLERSKFEQLKFEQLKFEHPNGKYGFDKTGLLYTHRQINRFPNALFQTAVASAFSPVIFFYWSSQRKRVYTNSHQMPQKKQSVQIL